MLVVMGWSPSVKCCEAPGSRTGALRAIGVGWRGDLPYPKCDTAIRLAKPLARV
jgi:hypothetical protein